MPGRGGREEVQATQDEDQAEPEGQDEAGAGDDGPEGEGRPAVPAAGGTRGGQAHRVTCPAAPAMTCSSVAARETREVPSGRHVADLQLERLEAAELPAVQTRRDVDDVALGQADRQVVAPEGDGVEDLAAPAQHERGVAAGGRPDPADGQAADADQGVRVARRDGPEGVEVAQEPVVDLGGIDGQVKEQRLGARGRCRFVPGREGEERQEALPQGRVGVRRELAPGGLRVAAMALEEIGARLEGRRELAAGRPPAGGTPRLGAGGDDDGRGAAVFREAAGDQADDADRPRPGDDDGPGRQVRDRRVRLVEDRRGEVAPLAIGRLEPPGELVRGRGVGRQQEVGRRGHVAHPAAGVQARRQGEADALQVHPLRRHAGRGEQGRDAGTRCGAQPGQPEASDGEVLAGDGRHVGDRADDGQVGQVEGGGRATRLAGQEQLRDLEGDATAGQAGVRVDAVVTMRVDQRHRGGRDRRHVMMVGDDDVDAARRREGDLGDAARAGVDGDDQAAVLRRWRGRWPPPRGRGPPPRAPARASPRPGPAAAGP